MAELLLLLMTVHMWPIDLDFLFLPFMNYNNRQTRELGKGEVVVGGSEHLNRPNKRLSLTVPSAAGARAWFPRIRAS
jgi:hypothetical protein